MPPIPRLSEKLQRWRHLLELWRGACNEGYESRRRLERRRLASSVLSGRSRLGLQIKVSQAFQAWIAEAREGRASAWAYRSARQGQAKAALAARIALNEECACVTLLLQEWRRAALAQRRSRGRAAARQALAMSLGRWELRGLVERWADSAKQSRTERWLAEQRAAEKLKDLRSRAAAARRMVADSTGTFLSLVTQSWRNAVCTLRQERRQQSAGIALAAGLDATGQSRNLADGMAGHRFILSNWHQLAIETRQVRADKRSRKDGVRTFCKGLMGFLQTSHDELTVGLLLRMVWQSWLCSATSGQVLRFARFYTVSSCSISAAVRQPFRHLVFCTAFASLQSQLLPPSMPSMQCFIIHGPA
eukprot:s4412_g4.t1